MSRKNCPAQKSKPNPWFTGGGVFGTLYQPQCLRKSTPNSVHFHTRYSTGEGCLVPCTSLSVSGDPHQTLYTSKPGTVQAAGCLVPCTILSVYGNPHQTLYTSILGTVQALLLYSDVVDPNKFDLDPDLTGKFASSDPFLTYISEFN